jgi:hypothetical protein
VQWNESREVSFPAGLDGAITLNNLKTDNIGENVKIKIDATGIHLFYTYDTHPENNFEDHILWASL